MYFIVQRSKSIMGWNDRSVKSFVRRSIFLYPVVGTCRTGLALPISGAHASCINPARQIRQICG